MHKCLFLLTFFSVQILCAQDAISYNIKVVDEHNVGLPGATIQVSTEVKQDLIKTVVDQEGTLQLTFLQGEKYSMSISHLGYKDIDLPLDFSHGQSGPISLLVNMELADIPISPVEISIGRYNEIELLPNLAEKITIDELRKLPATFFDPARLAQSFAGVASNNDQANGISIRGNDPAHFKWYLEGVEIVNPNHTSNAGTVSDRPSQSAGGVNILSAQMLSQSQFYKSNYPGAFQNANAGILAMSLRNGNREERKHVAQIGLLGLELSSEGPISKEKNKGSYLFNYRFSTVGALTQLGVDFGGEEIDYQDLAFTYSQPTERGLFKIFAVGGLSNNRFTAPAEESEREEEKDNTDIDFSGDMGLVGLNYDVLLTEDKRLNFTSVFSANRFDRQSTLIATTNEEFEFDQDRNTLWSSKISLDHKTEKLNWQYGLYFNWLNYALESTIRENIFLDVEGESLFRGGAFAKIENIYHEKWNWTAALNISTQQVLDNNEVLVEPRLQLFYKVGANQRIQLGTGLYSQNNAPRVFHLNATDTADNLHNVKSWQNTLSYTVRLKKMEWKTEAFFQHLYNALVTPETNFSSLNGIDGLGAQILSNDGLGRNIGLETSLRSTPNTSTWTWWANATLYRSQYRTASLEWRNSRFDGRYIFNVLVGKEWNRSATKTHGVHLRANYLGGFRETPIDIDASRQFQRTVFIDEEAFTEKQSDYFRVDLSVYRRVIHEKFTSTISLDIQNVSNTSNDSFEVYDSFLDRIVRREQLGIIPVLTYRLQF